MAKKKSRRQLKWRLFLLCVLSFVVTLAPLFVVFGMNFPSYVETPKDTFKLCLGGVIVLIFVMLKVMGKLRVPRRVVAYAVIFVLSFLLEAVLADLMMLSGAALAGEAVDYIIFQRAIKATREALLVQKTAEATTDATADKVEELLQKYIGGRV